MLSGDKVAVETLRGLKNAVNNEVINTRSQESGISDEQIQKVLAREAKARAEAAEVYKKAGETERADKELAEKKLIKKYLPQPMSPEQLKPLVAKHIDQLGANSPADMGKVIGAVKREAGTAADGATVASLVREALANK